MSRLTCKDCIHDVVCRFIHHDVACQYIHGVGRLACEGFMPRRMEADLARGADMTAVGGEPLTVSDAAYEKMIMEVTI